MKSMKWVIIGLVVIIGLLVVGIVAGRVGGIAIRNQATAPAQVLVRISEPVVRGVPVAVDWDASMPNMPATLSFEWRDEQNKFDLGTAAWQDGRTTLQFPCVSEQSNGGLVLRSADDGKVVGTQLIELAPAGPECIR
jgi:hypothetical protein